jgi:CubicO group peptidase (beta-lactamase class C family)
MKLEGYCAPAFDEVREVFSLHFHQGLEVGAALAVYHQGKLVVDLAAGLRDLAPGEPYTRDVLQPVFSVTKGITAVAANMLADRGALDLDAPVRSYWSEFGAAGKREVPVRWLLTHQSGVLGLDPPVTQAQLLDWNYMAKRLAAQSPVWEPGSKHGYHSMTYGFLVGEIIRRASGRSVGRYVAEEIAGPLGAKFFIGLPANRNDHVAPVLFEPKPGKALKLPDSGPYANHTLSWISPPLGLSDVNREDVRAAELPAANGIGNARSLARIFAATIGTIDGVRLLSPLGMNRARAEQWRGLDEVMGIENALGLGLLLPTEWCPLGGQGSFGTAGLGGSRGWAHPELSLAFGYTPNLCRLDHFDGREAALSHAAVSCAKRLAKVTFLTGAYDP